MTKGQRRDWGAAGIGALLLGLLAAPWVYAAFGALSAFPAPFGLAAVPLLLLATLDLGWEAFAQRRRFKAARLIAAGVSAAIFLTILSVLTEFTLLTATEQAGLFSTVWLGASMAWLVASLPLGEVGPEAILRPFLASNVLSITALAIATLAITALAVLSWQYLTTPAAFIG